ncbi:MAG TPA: LysM peptidoglycan-binding domain-containing protein [Anaerolineaceae bacterium]|nr:LysM peptidoglycan-binding domain-containing protein [Anaerolineaceae bacterium]
MTIRRPEPEFIPAKEMLHRRLLLIVPTALVILVVIALFSLLRPAPKGNGQAFSPASGDPGPDPTRPAVMIAFPSGKATFTPFTPATREPGAPLLSPTPDPPRLMPTPRLEPDQYTVQGGDSLGKIAQHFNISWGEIAAANQLVDPDHLEPGQVLTIPAPKPGSGGPDFKIIPDSELVYGPASTGFDVAAFIKKKGGILANYSEDVDGETLSGTQIIERVTYEYSVNPRLLLAVLEYQGRWVTTSNPDETLRKYPIGQINPYRAGLYKQMAFAADNLNRGYYLWRVNGLTNWILVDGAVIPISSTINAGTAGVQNFFATLLDSSNWKKAVSSDGLFATYQAFFGYPFDYSIDPLLPPGLAQPHLHLPFEKGAVWSFTGGPHGGWGDGSAWAALDFAPPGEAYGCFSSPSWVVAMADGLITRAHDGAVIEDLDGDGYEQTGWVILYMHISSEDRIQPGTVVKAGDRIGHPSCEGGVSNGTHTHIARRYNGEWIPADGLIPFNLDDWISSGNGAVYDGYLTRNDQRIEAWDGRTPENQISR